MLAIRVYFISNYLRLHERGSFWVIYSLLVILCIHSIHIVHWIGFAQLLLDSEQKLFQGSLAIQETTCLCALALLLA
jgi:hypothetical protein